MHVLKPEWEAVLTKEQNDIIKKMDQDYIDQNRAQDAEIMRYFHGCEGMRERV